MLGVIRKLLGLVGSQPRDENGDDTEFMCEVVEVAEVLPHPNADRLEILQLRSKRGLMGVTVVDRKGQRAVGDKVAYLSVDCIVPTNRPEFAFLKERLDGQGKDYYRLKAARLRGVYSEGLVVDCPQGFQTLGASLQDHFSVTYHNPDVEVAGPTQPSGKRKRDWRRNLVPEYGVTSLKKDRYLFKEGEDVTVTEKVHGTNARFGWVRHGLRWHFVVGSHRTFKSDNRGWWPWSAAGRKFGKSHRDATGWYSEDLYSKLAETMNLATEMWDARGIVFYGEIFGLTYSGQKIQDLTYGLTGPALRLFDGFDTRKHRWLNRAELEHYAACMGLAVVKELYEGPYDEELVRGLAEGTSLHDEGTVREGVVVESRMRGYDFGQTDRKGKWVSEGYRLRGGQS